MQQNDFARDRLGLIASFFLVLLLGCSPLFGDQFILRDATIVRDRVARQVDEDGVHLDDGTLIGWDRIEQGRVDSVPQAEFDRFLAELGPPLYRIRLRTRIGDYRDILDAVNEVYSRYQGRVSPSSYLVAQAAMWARLANGQREQALEPYLRCWELLRVEPALESDLPGNRRLLRDMPTGLSPELTPVWFDEESAREQLPLVRSTIRGMRNRPAGVYVYYATLAIQAGESGEIERVLDAIDPSVERIGELKAIVLAQREIRAGKPGSAYADLLARVDSLSDANRPLARYWIGTAELEQPGDEARMDGMLQLLRIPAVHGKQFPELAAAALFRVSQELQESDDVSGSVTVRNELLEKFSQTYHARRATAATSPP